ncbi:MAG: hypothetical protein ACXVJK_07470 [Candidatus Aminicenantales bacterium]
MENHDRFDEELAKLVRSVERSVPPDVEHKLQVAAATLRPRRRNPLIRRPLLLAALPAVAIVVLAFLFIVRPARGPEVPQISEIRTEFEIADKNITIVFVQRPDFPVFVTAF